MSKVVRNQFWGVPSRLRPIQIFLGFYGVTIFFVILLPFQYLHVEQWNLYHSAKVTFTFSFTEIHWFQYLGAFLLFAIPVFVPKIPKRYVALVSTRDLASFGLFYFISSSSYLFGSPEGISWTNFEYHSVLLTLPVLFGGLITSVNIAYGNPYVPPSLDGPFNNNEETRRVRWELIREEQERWWKELQLFLPVIIALMISTGLGWANSTVPQEVEGAYKYKFLSYRMTQITWIEGIALIGVITIVFNIVGRINLLHRKLESEYLDLVNQPAAIRRNIMSPRVRRHGPPSDTATQDKTDA